VRTFDSWAGKPRVVILGGGFGGLYAAKALKGAAVQVTIVDRRNHHLFQPLLYQVATAALNPSDIAVPIRSVFRRQPNVQVVMAAATSVDLAQKRLVLDDGALPYDHLILATGASHSYFGNDAWAPLAPGLKSVEDALEIRRRMLLAFEAAERETDPEAQKALLTFVIVGGGPTGVELAGAMAEVSDHTLPGEFDHIDSSQARVIVVEGQPHVLPVLPAPLPEKADRQLHRMGVELMGGWRVVSIDAGGVDVVPALPGGAERRRIAARTVIWAAGVAASPIAKSLGVPLDRAGRVIVTPELTVPGHDEVSVVGDLAAFLQDGKTVTGLAPIAIQEGRHAARNVLARIAGRTPAPFRYVDKGVFCTIGRGKAVGEIAGRVKVTGAPAWLAWLAIHIFFLIGFRNRVAVLLGWAYSYLTWRRGARLITGETRLPRPP
jgi:NADH dehydrogenase